jgi:Phage tail sheath C-terminal domain
VVGDQIKVLGTALGGTSPTNDVVFEITEVNGSGGAVAITYISGAPPAKYTVQLSNWVTFTYTANEGAPTVAPANNTNWFYSVTDQVDIMVQKGGSWIGYRNTAYDSTGHPAATGSNTTDPNGPILSATAPTTQSDGTSLSYGDLWIDTSDLENYPIISRWQLVNGTPQWVLIDNTDQVSSNGVLFQDARWATSGTVSPTDDPIPTIVSLLSSNYLDLDAPEPTLYPQGMLLFNTRRSGYNVKQFRVDYFNSTSFPDSVLPTETSAWVTISGNQANGSPYMGRKAQRAVVVAALRSAIATNTAIRDEDNFFNLIATPNYPELQPDMIELNSARGETAYIIGDTPLGLPDSATDIQAWATNAAGATSTGEDGLVTRNTYLGLFYPSGLTTDPRTGNLVAVPPSHMMLYTFLKNDTISYPWLAAAGTRRGLIYNATNIGYVDRTTGEFQTIKTRIGIRDVLYINFINPLTFFTGVGLLNYGNKTSYDSQSALDRTNVARLVAYIRRQLTIAARPFVFEPNDALTRQSIAGVIQTLMVDLKAKRGIYDYLVQCDDQNNPPAVIDRNELYVNVAIEPVKAAEFIYIPVRVYNTGEIANLAVT